MSAIAAIGAFGIASPRPAAAQWATTYETFYLQAPHNWTFRRDYAFADRLFNAFDYGHAILYETLWTRPSAPASELEVRRYEDLTRRVLVRPPRVPLEESAIEIEYAKLVPEVKTMFDWAHILHRQLYDVLADERLDRAREGSRSRAPRRLLSHAAGPRVHRRARSRWRSCRSSRTRSRSGRRTRSSTG